METGKSLWDLQLNCLHACGLNKAKYQFKLHYLCTMKDVQISITICLSRHDSFTIPVKAPPPPLQQSTANYISGKIRNHQITGKIKRRCVRRGLVENEVESKFPGSRRSTTGLLQTQLKISQQRKFQFQRPRYTITRSQINFQVTLCRLTREHDLRLKRSAEEKQHYTRSLLHQPRDLL